MPEKPSWQTSTLSQLAVISMVCYLVGCFMLIIGGGWIFKNPEFAMKGYDGLRWAVESLVIGYLARSTTSKNNGQGQVDEKPPTEVKPPEVKPGS